jgi:hypothetical protein
VNAQEVITRCRDLGVTLAVSPEGKLRATPPGKLPEALREELKQHKGEVLALLAQQEPPQTLYQEVCQATPPPAALEVFPEWRGLLVKSKVLDLTVWVVRSRQEGEALAKETGHAAVLLDDILKQKGRTPAEARASILPVLITGSAH